MSSDTIMVASLVCVILHRMGFLRFLYYSIERVESRIQFGRVLSSGLGQVWLPTPCSTENQRHFLDNLACMKPVREVPGHHDDEAHLIVFDRPQRQDSGTNFVPQLIAEFPQVPRVHAVGSFRQCLYTVYLTDLGYHVAGL